MANRAGLKMNINSVTCEIPSLRGSWVQIPLPPLQIWSDIQEKLTSAIFRKSLYTNAPNDTSLLPDS